MAFYFSYMGNKRSELPQLFSLIDISDYDTVVEPFGGTCVFSRELYKKTPSLCYEIADTDASLVLFCNSFHADDDAVISDALETIDRIGVDKETYKTFIKNEPPTSDLHAWLVWYLIYRTYYQIRHGLYPTKPRKPSYRQLLKIKGQINEFFKAVPYQKQDYKTTMEKHKHNPRALVFIDPPYVSACNVLYSNPEVDWEYLFTFFESCECKFIMVVNNDFFMRMAFKKWFIDSYDKKYSNHNKSLTKHQIFSNIQRK